VANAYYDSGAERAARVERLFARIARRYDLLNDLQSFGVHRVWKDRVVSLAGIKPGDQALDVCCGTGDLTLRLARSGASVTGLDFTREMLDVAERRRNKDPSGLPVKFVSGDAQILPFENSSFDVVTVGYGLRNLADWKTGLAEMERVARPGGRLLVLDFGKPRNPAWRWLYFAYLRMFVPVLGLLFCGDAQAYAYILESLHHYPAQEGVRDQMKAMGLADVQVFEFFGGMMSINFGVRSK